VDKLYVVIGLSFAQALNDQPAAGSLVGRGLVAHRLLGVRHQVSVSASPVGSLSALVASRLT
jgi:hypothetical protein